MIDHISVDVSDLKKSGHFYDNALKPLGYKKLMEAPQVFGGRLVFGWGDSAETELYIGEGTRNEPRLHIAFRAGNRKNLAGDQKIMKTITVLSYLILMVTT